MSYIKGLNFVLGNYCDNTFSPSFVELFFLYHCVYVVIQLNAVTNYACYGI